MIGAEFSCRVSCRRLENSHFRDRSRVRDAYFMM